MCAGGEGGREGERLGALGGPGARQEVSALARGLTSGRPGADLTVRSVLSLSEPQLHRRGAQAVPDSLHPAASPRTGKGISF